MPRVYINHKKNFIDFLEKYISDITDVKISSNILGSFLDITCNNTKKEGALYVVADTKVFVNSNKDIIILVVENKNKSDFYFSLVIYFLLRYDYFYLSTTSNVIEGKDFSAIIFLKNNQLKIDKVINTSFPSLFAITAKSNEKEYIEIILPHEELEYLSVTSLFHKILKKCGNIVFNKIWEYNSPVKNNVFTVFVFEITKISDISEELPIKHPAGGLYEISYADELAIFVGNFSTLHIMQTYGENIIQSPSQSLKLNVIYKRTSIIDSTNAISIYIYQKNAPY